MALLWHAIFSDPLLQDITERVEEEAAADRELQLHKEQELSNLLHRKDYVRAVGVAISLDQPNRVRTILQGMWVWPSHWSHTGSEQYFKIQFNSELYAC